MKGGNWDDPVVEWNAEKQAAAVDAYRKHFREESFQLVVTPRQFHELHLALTKNTHARCPVCHPWDRAK